MRGEEGILDECQPYRPIMLIQSQRYETIHWQRQLNSPQYMIYRANDLQYQTVTDECKVTRL